MIYLVIYILALYPTPEMTHTAVNKDPNLITLLIEKYERQTGRVVAGLMADWWTWKHNPAAKGIRGVMPGQWPTYPLQMGDINHDQRVDLLDFALVARWYPAGGLAGSYIPVEPNVPAPKVETKTIDPNDWTLEQKALYLRIIMMLGD